MKNFDYREQTFGYEDDDNNSVTWPVPDIIRHASKIKIEKVSVAKFKGFLDFTVKRYNEDDWYRVKNANLSYPILIGSDNFTFTSDKTKGEYPYLFDGVHRLVKASMAGLGKIDAKVLSSLPDPSFSGVGLLMRGISYSLNDGNGFSTLSPELRSLVIKSTHIKKMGNWISGRSSVHVTPIVDSVFGIVGFAVVVKYTDDRWGCEPLFIDQPHRGKGFALKWISQFYTSRKGRVYIPSDDKLFEAVLTKIGFRKQSSSPTTKFSEYLLG